MRKYLVLTFIVILVLAISGCAPFTPAPPTKATLTGQVVVPQGVVRQVGGQALPGATVNVIDPVTGDIIATTTTDANGNYQVEVPPGGPYIIEAVKGSIKVLDVSPQVEVGQSYDLGAADATSTAVALVFQAKVEAGEDPAEINLDEIAEDPKIDNLIEAIEEALAAGEDPTTAPEVTQVVEVIVTPPAPTPKPTPKPTPAPAPAPTPDITPPQITALSFAEVNGTKDASGIWTVDISGVTDENLLDQGSMTVSKACTLMVKTIDGTDASGWFQSVSLTAGDNTGGLKELLGFSQSVTFAILRIQDTDNDGYLTVVVKLEDSASNKSEATIKIKYPPAPAIIYNQTKKTYYETIQNAIGDAGSGDIIIVGVGIFNEAISIDKSLTLLGAQAGVDARNRFGDETIIDPNDPNGGGPKSWVIRVRASNVTIEGFTIQNPSLIYGSAGLIDISQGVWNNIQIKNNILQNPGNKTSNSTNWGKFGINIEGASNVRVENNYFRNILCDTATPWNGTAAIWPSGSSNIEILNNRIENITTYGVGLSDNNSNVLIMGNEISLGDLGGTPSWTRSGIRVGIGNDDINISNNNISNCEGTEKNSAGIRLQNAANVTTEVSGNIVSNINIGIAIEPDADNFNITGNTFSNIKVLGGYRWYNIHGSDEDLKAVLENNSFPDGSEVQSNPDTSKLQNRIIVPGGLIQ